MSVAPMKYTERTALGQHLKDEDHDLLIDMYRGFSPAGTFVSPYTFIISKNGVTYTASNAYQTVYSGSDAATVIQDAADDANDTGYGGTLKFTYGNFPLTKKVVVPASVSMIGEGSNCAFREVQNQPVTNILADATITDDRLFELAPKYYGQIASMNFEGEDLVDKCIWAFSPQGASFRNLVLHKALEAAFMVEANSTAATTATHNLFEKVIISDTTGQGMDLKGESDTYPVALNTFIGCRFEATHASLRLEQYADTNVFIGGRVEVHSQEFPGGDFTHGIVLGESSHVANSGVYNNGFFNVPIDGYDPYENGSIKGVYLNWNDTPNYFYGGVFGGPDLSGMDADHKVSKQTNGQAFFYNFRNYVTENEGYVDDLEDDGVIAHGLVREPRQVFLTSHEEMYHFTVSATDATNITCKIRYSDNDNFDVVVMGDDGVTPVTLHFPQTVVAVGGHGVYWRANVQPVGVW
jgi:hypothetical protein